MQDITTDILPPETAATTTAPAPLALKLDEGLEPATAASLREAFEAYFRQADEWRAKAIAIQITRPDQVREMKLARETRLALREIRINAEKTRKRLKEDSLRKGKAIDGIYNMLAFAVEPLEAHLLAQEQFLQRMEEERKAKLKADREAALAPFGVDVRLYQLGEMDDATFDQLLETNRLAYAARQEAAAKAEADRIAREAAEAAERERIRLENEQLRAAAAAAEAKAKAEREKAEAERREIERKAAEERAAAEAKAKAERDARERVEAELRAKEEAEAKAKAEAEAAARAAAAAPDREKLAALAEAIREVPIPTLTSEHGREAEKLIHAQFAKFAAWVESLAAKL